MQKQKNNLKQMKIWHNNRIVFDIKLIKNKDFERLFNFQEDNISK